MAEDARIVVVGAGPVGLVAAMRLAEAGIPTVVLEREAAVSDDLRASTFHPPTLDMLAPCGLTAALEAEGLVCPSWQIRMHETGERAVFDLSVIAGDTDHPYRLQCEQARLCRHLAARLAADPAVELRFSCAVAGLDQDADGVRVTVERDGGTETLAARWVIGADGAGSTVRRLIGLDFAGTTYPETTVLASTPFPFHAHIEGLSNVSYCWSATGNFALLRLPEFWRCSLYYDPSLGLEEAASEARVQEQLDGICPGMGPFEIVDRRPYRVHQRIVDDYRRGRVLLAGDAAHVNSPSGGMGMNGGIHDAFALTDALAAVWRGGDEGLLDRYTRTRRPVAERQILAQADRNRKRMTERDPAKRRAELAEMQAIAGDPARARPFLLRSSMITGLREAESLP